MKTKNIKKFFLLTICYFNIGLTMLFFPFPLIAQQIQYQNKTYIPANNSKFVLSLDRSAYPLTVPSNGLIQIGGSIENDKSGTTFDAAHEFSSTSRKDGGIIDTKASGLILKQSNKEDHIYTYEVNNRHDTLCAEAGLQSPCLILRLAELSASRLRDIDEFREELTGTLQVETFVTSTPVNTPQSHPLQPPPRDLYQPDMSDQSETSWFFMGLAGAGGALGLGLLVIIVLRRKTNNSPHSHSTLTRVEDSVLRLRQKLKNETTKARLLDVIEDLAREASSLAQLEKKFADVINKENLENLETQLKEKLAKADKLSKLGGQEAGEEEMRDAARIVENRIEHCQQWERQMWRCSARLEHIATRLEALEAEFNDPTSGQSEPRQELLNLLEEELELAKAGEKEASALLDRHS